MEVLFRNKKHLLRNKYGLLKYKLIWNINENSNLEYKLRKTQIRASFEVYQ